MTNTPENNKKRVKFKTTRAFWDLVIIVILAIFIFIISYFFDFFAFIVRFLEKYPQKIVYVDEVITALLTLSVSLAVFAWRRWAELRKETAERIKLQEELLRIAETKIETERIISKQLHSELEQRKQLETSRNSKIK